MRTNPKKISTEKMVTMSVLIALIVVLQSFSSVAARIGLFSFALGLFPATIGSVLYGKKASVLFGAVLGAVILATDPTAYALYAVNFFATVASVMLKSIAGALVTALLFELLSKVNRYVAVLAAAIAAPIVNTGIFTACVCLFFKDFFSSFVDDGTTFIVGFLLLIALNFAIEMGINVVLAPAVLRVTELKKKK